MPSLETFRESLQTPNTYHEAMYSLTCAQEENCLASTANANDPYQYRLLLKFDSLTMNYGRASFIPHAPRAEWQWHSCHHHYHSMEAFIDYDVLDLNRRKVAEGHKASFCLEDSICEGRYHYFSCSSGIQGISVHCGDLYSRNLDCQWIDVTDLPSGDYIIRQHVNAQGLVPESDTKNNIIECRIKFQTPYYSLGNCTHSGEELYYIST